MKFNNAILDNSLDLIHTPSEEIAPILGDAVAIQKDRGVEIQAYRFGFNRLPFFTDRNQEGFALHDWHTDENVPHTHIFKLKCRALYGPGILNYFWDEAQPDEPNAEGPFRAIGPSYSNPGQVQYEGPPVDLRASKPQLVDPINNPYYELPIGAVHSTRLVGGRTLTLMQRSNTLAGKIPINYIGVGSAVNNPPRNNEDGWRHMEEIVGKYLRAVELQGNGIA